MLSPPELSRQQRGSASLPRKVQGRGAAVNNRKGRAVTPWGRASPASCGQQLPREEFPAQGPRGAGAGGVVVPHREHPGGAGEQRHQLPEGQRDRAFGTPALPLLLESAQHGLAAKLGDGRTSPRGWDQDKSWAAATAIAPWQMPRICTFSKGKPVLGCLLTLQISSLHKPGSAAGAWIHAVLCAGIWESTEGFPELTSSSAPSLGDLSAALGLLGGWDPQDWSHTQGTAQGLSPSPCPAAKIPRSCSQGSQHKFWSNQRTKTELCGHFRVRGQS